MKTKYTLNYCKKYASDRGGKCLEPVFYTHTTLMSWRCYNGHSFKISILDLINRHTWCTKCYADNKLDINECKAVAKLNNGECLSDSIDDKNQLLTWRCSENHLWREAFWKIKRNIADKWCFRCKTGGHITSFDCHVIAIDNRGECLSKKYEGDYVFMEWKCENNHVWEDTFYNIKYARKWCPFCTEPEYDNLLKAECILQNKEMIIVKQSEKKYELTDREKKRIDDTILEHNEKKQAENKQRELTRKRKRDELNRKKRAQRRKLKLQRQREKKIHNNLEKERKEKERKEKERKEQIDLQLGVKNITKQDIIIFDYIYPGYTLTDECCYLCGKVRHGNHTCIKNIGIYV
jgi:hypothetical protein